MPNIDYQEAAAVFEDEAAHAESAQVDAEWARKVEELSELCEAAGIRTHIAFLGAALIAKSVDASVSLKWIKPKLAAKEGEKDIHNAFSIRPLSERVLVPMAAKLGVHIGVTGRQPLNNQPYFRMRYLGDDTPISPAARPPFDYMRQLVDELQSLSEAESRQALRAFIRVRRSYQPKYEAVTEGVGVSPDQFIRAVQSFVGENSEGGKRAQACVAAVFDTVFGAENVLSGRINDPSRRRPGDVCVTDRGGVVKAIEVKDAPIELSDIQIFCQKCLDMGVTDTGYALLAANQRPLDAIALMRWAQQFGVEVELFTDWEQLGHRLIIPDP